ncbi:MAG TPA: GcrA family cell cycle regulator [Acidobacteriaceae bacterium]|jgi:hypothetical protein
MIGFTFRSWPEEKIIQLKAMWWEGLSAELICLELGATSPRAVTEKVQRSGFKRNPDVKRSRGDVYEIPELLLPHVREDGTLITMETVGNRECRYIFDEPGSSESPMCGRETVNSSWCPYHRKRVFVKSAALA